MPFAENRTLAFLTFVDQLSSNQSPILGLILEIWGGICSSLPDFLDKRPVYLGIHSHGILLKQFFRAGYTCPPKKIKRDVQMDKISEVLSTVIRLLFLCWCWWLLSCTIYFWIQLVISSFRIPYFRIVTKFWIFYLRI